MYSCTRNFQFILAPFIGKRLTGCAIFSFQIPNLYQHISLTSLVSEFFMIFLLTEQSQAMINQLSFQQAWSYYSTPRNNQQSHLVTQHGDDSEGLNRSLTSWSDYGWKKRCSQIGINVSSQAVPLYNSQPHSVFTSFVQSPNVDLTLSVLDAEYQFPANNQQNFLS